MYRLFGEESSTQSTTTTGIGSNADNTSVNEQPWYTADPLVTEILGLEVPSNAQIGELIKKQGYTWASPNAVVLHNDEKAGQGMKANELIPSYTAFPYSGRIEFINLHGGNTKAASLTTIKSISDLETLAIAVTEIDVPKGEILNVYLAQAKKRISDNFKNGDFTPSRIDLVWHKPSESWYLVMTKQLRNASIVELKDLPELIKSIRSAGIDITNLKGKELINDRKKLDIVIVVLQNFASANDKMPQHFCYLVAMPIVIGINGTTSVPHACANMQHCPQADMTRVTSSSSFELITLKFEESHLLPIPIGFNKTDIKKGTMLTCNYGFLAERFIPKAQMIIWDNSAQHLNPLLALRLPELYNFTIDTPEHGVQNGLMLAGVDDLWVLLKKKPDVFEYIVKIANNQSSDDLVNLVQKKPQDLRTQFANNLYRTYMNRYKACGIIAEGAFSLLPTSLDANGSNALLRSPHSAFNFLRDKQAVQQMRDNAKKPTFNWYLYLRIPHYTVPEIDIPKNQKDVNHYAVKRKASYELGLKEYKKSNEQGFQQAISHWLQALGYAIVESIGMKDKRHSYIHGKNIFISDRTMTISWGLANAYKKLGLYEDALCFFELVKEHVYCDVFEWEKTAKKDDIQTRIQECRQGILSNSTPEKQNTTTTTSTSSPAVTTTTTVATTHSLRTTTMPTPLHGSQSSIVFSSPSTQNQSQSQVSVDPVTIVHQQVRKN